MNYFDKFPKVTYGKNRLTDITRRLIPHDSIFYKPFIYMPYTVKNDEKIEEVAYYYYGDPEASWLITIANSIINPYYEWVLSADQFDKMLIEKYRVQSGLTDGYAILAWTMNTSSQDNIDHYYLKDNPSIKITKTGYQQLTLAEKNDWQVKRIWDEEFDQNESKRVIQLINKAYYNQAIVELQRLVNE